MARALNRLSAREVSAVKRPGLIADGGNLYLQVNESGAKSWLFRFMRQGQSRAMGLGSLNAVSLAKAREKAARCRSLLADGIDPIEARRAERARRKANDRKTIIFEDAADAYIAAHEAGWKSDKHASQWRNTLKTYAYPELGELAVSEIDTAFVMRVLKPIWTTKSEMAGRVRGRIERVLDWATVSGYRTGENPARWRGHLDNLLPAQNRVQKIRHHAALPYDEIGKFMQRLRDREGVAARALEFAILTAARTSEVIGATWDEIDLEKSNWTIPDERMKGEREHRVPLSDRAIKILRELHETATGEFVFPGGKQNSSLSNMALLSLLRRMDIAVTAHGFRSTFRDWCAEQTNYPREVAEQALAHVNGDKVEAAYRRGDLFEKRQRLMDAWAEYCSTENRGGDVVPLRGRELGGRSSAS